MAFSSAPEKRADGSLAAPHGTGVLVASGASGAYGAYGAYGAIGLECALDLAQRAGVYRHWGFERLPARVAPHGGLWLLLWRQRAQL